MIKSTYDFVNSSTGRYAAGSNGVLAGDYYFVASVDGFSDAFTDEDFTMYLKRVNIRTGEVETIKTIDFYGKAYYARADIVIARNGDVKHVFFACQYAPVSGYQYIFYGYLEDPTSNTFIESAESYDNIIAHYPTGYGMFLNQPYYHWGLQTTILWKWDENFYFTYDGTKFVYNALDTNEPDDDNVHLEVLWYSAGNGSSGSAIATSGSWFTDDRFLLYSLTQYDVQVYDQSIGGILYDDWEALTGTPTYTSISTSATGIIVDYTNDTIFFGVSFPSGADYKYKLYHIDFNASVIYTLNTSSGTDSVGDINVGEQQHPLDILDMNSTFNYDRNIFVDKSGAGIYAYASQEIWYNDNGTLRLVEDIHYNDNGTLRTVWEVWENTSGIPNQILYGLDRGAITREELDTLITAYNNEPTMVNKKAIENANVSQIEDFFLLFNGSSFNGDISKWDVSSVTNMSCMFMSSAFNGDISKWDVSSVTDMSVMFGYTDFNGNITNWNVSNVGSFGQMFDGNSTFNQDISKWDTSSAWDMTQMFAGCDSFNQDISSWDVSNVDWMFQMFAWCDSFNQDLSSWDVSNVSDYEGFDSGASAWTLPKPSFV